MCCRTMGWNAPVAPAGCRGTSGCGASLRMRFLELVADRARLKSARNGAFACKWAGKRGYAVPNNLRENDCRSAAAQEGAALADSM